jgi:hypothetical protein
LSLDWGFAALLEYQGKRILFDTGNNAKIFEHNVQELKVDRKKLDAVVISHRHSDHTGGHMHLLKVNPDVKIYVPQEPAVVIGKAPLAFFKREPGLTPRMSYYQGREPQGATGTPWYLYGDWRFPSRCDAAAGSRAHSFDLGRVAETQAGRAWPLHERAGPFRSGRSGERDQAALRRGQPYRGRRSRATRELVLGQQRTGGATRHRVAPREEVHACRRYARP